jgi:hypothetical protein
MGTKIDNFWGIVKDFFNWPPPSVLHGCMAGLYYILLEFGWQINDASPKMGTSTACA